MLLTCIPDVEHFARSIYAQAKQVTAEDVIVSAAQTVAVIVNKTDASQTDAINRIKMYLKSEIESHAAASITFWIWVNASFLFCECR